MPRNCHYLCWVAIFFLTIPIVTADIEPFSELNIFPPSPPREDDQLTLSLALREYKTKSPISDIHVDVETTNWGNGEKTKTLMYVSEKGILHLGLAPAKWGLKLGVDKLTTDGKDYFFESYIDLAADTNLTVYLLPVGSVMGTVYEDNKAVKGALVKLSCAAAHGDAEETTTDSFGAFTSYWVGVGACKVSARHNNKLGHQAIIVRHGEITDIKINLNETFSSGKAVLYLILTLITGAGIITAMIYARQKKGEIKPEQTETKPSQTAAQNNETPDFPGRSKDIMKTLTDKEKEIVELLFKNNNRSTQSRIKNELGIPKTTLARVLLGLEVKNIIKIEKIGKLKKVELTAWFTGKA